MCLYLIVIKIDSSERVRRVLLFISTVQHMPEFIGLSSTDSSCPHTGQLIRDKAAAASPTTGYS